MISLDMKKLAETSVNFLESEEKKHPIVIRSEITLLRFLIIERNNLVSDSMVHRMINYITRHINSRIINHENITSQDEVSVVDEIWKLLILLSETDINRARLLQGNISKMFDNFRLLFETISTERILLMDNLSTLLGNLTINIEISEMFVSGYEDVLRNIMLVFEELCRLGNLKEAGLYCHTLQNVAQTSKGRKCLWIILKEIDPLTPFSTMFIAMKGTAPDDLRISYSGLIKNLLFDYDEHQTFVKNGVLGPLVLPLAGEDVFTVEENEKMEVDWQFLLDKSRDHSVEARHNILDSLLMLCHERSMREILRQKNLYLILREYHKEESDERNLETLEAVVNFLIRTEEEIGVENLRSISEGQP